MAGLQPEASTKSRQGWAASSYIPFSAIKFETKGKDRVCLGRGPYGKIYAGEYAGELVAIHEFQMDNGHAEIERVLWEISQQKALSHDHVVKVFGITFEGGPSEEKALLIVMERACLTLLPDSIQGSGKFADASITDRLRWLHQITKALRFIHSNKLIHGDLKPESIVLDSTTISSAMGVAPGDVKPSMAIAKLNNFNMPRTDDEAKGTRGTPLYMDPVLWNESGIISAASDIYSLAITAWNLLTKKAPFEAEVAGLRKEENTDVLKRLRELVTGGSRPSIAEVKKALSEGGLNKSQSEETANLLRKCWATAPEDRPKAMEVEQVLSRLLETPRTEARPRPSSIAIHSNGKSHHDKPLWLIDIHDLSLDTTALGVPKILGKGAWSAVYAANLGGSPVALKQVLDVTKECEQIFSAEVDIHYSLRSPYIVQVLGACMVDEPGEPPGYYVILECMAASLSSVCDHRSLLCGAPFKARVRWLLQVARALQFVHARRIIHGDVKLDNVMLSDVDSASIAKLTGFGQALPVPSSAREPVGTPVYMDPVILDGGGKLTPSSDIYSFGIMTWHLLTGAAVPYADVLGGIAADDLLPFLKEHVGVRGNRPSLRLLPEEATGTPGLVDLIDHCWHGSPLMRPSAEEVVATLQRIELLVRG